MSTNAVRSIDPNSIAKLDMKVEVTIIPVSDVDRAKEFYSKLGWRLDADMQLNNGLRIVQMTPHGSWCSVQFGAGLTSAAPGSAKCYLVVSDMESARSALVGAGVEVGGVFHIGAGGRIDGPDPEHRSYGSRASFSDPDGNGWVLQEVTTRLPGRVDSGVTSFGSATDLASALQRAAAAHGEHEKRLGRADMNWPEWYAQYMVAEQSGAGLPQ